MDDIEVNDKIFLDYNLTMGEDLKCSAHITEIGTRHIMMFSANSNPIAAGNRYLHINNFDCIVHHTSFNSELKRLEAL